MKKVFAVLLAVMLLLTASAFADGEAVRLAALKGPTAMGLVKLLEDHGSEYDFLLAGSADEITPKLIQGQIDIAAVPVNLASVLYNKTNGALKLIAVNALGVLYIVEKGETLKSLTDLKGKTLYATGKGSTPEYNLTYLLREAGLELGTDVTVEWKSEPAEVVALLKTQESGIAMLPQPYVTVAKTQVEGLETAFDLTACWDALENGSRLVTAGIVVREQYLQEHPEEVARFLTEFAASVEYVNANPAEAAVLIDNLGIVKAAVAEKALPQCNVVCITGAEMQQAVSGYLNVLFQLNPAAVGGALPDENLYYAAE
ncbi:MAG: ABC transporter substrate-binding protein [Clostridia bacterium]|nr:ABC transporter substrate-binding protein [Clostridia bacterium]